MFEEEEEKMEKFDRKDIRCPMLGGEVKFKYCRTMNSGELCESVLICWEGRISEDDLADAGIIED